MIILRNGFFLHYVGTLKTNISLWMVYHNPYIRWTPSTIPRSPLDRYEKTELCVEVSLKSQFGICDRITVSFDPFIWELWGRQQHGDLVEKAFLLDIYPQDTILKLKSKEPFFRWIGPNYSETRETGVDVRLILDVLVFSAAFVQSLELKVQTEQEVLSSISYLKLRITLY